MRYELSNIPVDQYENIDRVAKRKSPFAIFRREDDKSKMFLFAHGTEDGQIALYDNQYTCEEILKMFIEKKVIHEKGIKEVVTISCYGGKQTPACIDGVKIYSSHNHKDIIRAQAFVTIDNDECVLEIDIDE